MVALFARPGRESQRNEEGYRLVAGCIPYRYTKTGHTCNGESEEETLEVLMVTSHRGDGLVFPKGAWEKNESKEDAARREALEEAGVKGEIKFLGSWEFTSRRHRDECSPEGFRKSYMFALLVTEQLDSWPEKDVRQRKWVSVEEAKSFLRHEWMEEALKEAQKKCKTFCRPREVQSPLPESVDRSESPVSLSESSDEEPSEQSACDDDDSPSCPIEESAGSKSAVSLSQSSDEDLQNSLHVMMIDTPSCPTEEGARSVKLRKLEASSQNGCCSIYFDAIAFLTTMRS